jgi:hypothetical protein
MRRAYADKPALRRITQHSTFGHDNIQLGGGASPMYLANYFFPFSFTILEFAIYLLKNKNIYNNQKQNKNIS